MMIDEIAHEDLKSLVTGKLLGVGIHRKTFIYAPDKTLVIKCALEAPNINVLEDEVWLMVKNTKIAKWFAPCVAISHCGMFLLQKRAEVRPKSAYPKMIPSFFGDCKYSNFGWIDGQFVCVDYASFIATSMTHKWSGKMKKADWWE
jgi:hypothetical protein